MKDKIIVYPIKITPIVDNDKKHYLVTIPIIDRMTQGKDIPDALDMAADCIGSYSLVAKLPESNYVIPQTTKNEIATLVKVNISKYQRENDNRTVKKTLTIPNYLNELGIENKINFSHVLTKALKEIFNV